MPAKHAAGKAGKPAYEYLVLTVAELDSMIYRKLRQWKAAKDFDASTGQYVITKPDKAKSTYILPRILNPFGKKGWRLCAVNKMECYIFKRAAGDQKAYEYKVITPVEMDKAGIELLREKEAVRLSGEHAGSEVVEILDVEKARIQNVLPEILKSEAQEGWELVAVNGAQLYFFIRERKGGKSL